MDYLWTPWRYAYVSAVAKTTGCLFCEKPQLRKDANSLIVYRGKHSFVMLNAYPYTSGHVMIAPFAHIAELRKLPRAVAGEIMATAQRFEDVLRRVYHPEGLNLGMNIGKAAGAGVAGHLHLHLLPRWTADSNFMSVVAETRVLPEALETTYRRLKEQIDN